MSLLSCVQQRATRNGLNLVGLVDAARFDRSQPPEQRIGRHRRTCGTVVVLATAGREFWSEFDRQGRTRPRSLDDESVDELAASACVAVADELREQGVACRVVDSRRPAVSFGQLAEAAGFGVVSPVSGLLLHPEYGPWLRVRAALLVDGHPFGDVADASITEQFQPCCSCDGKPCVSVCPPSAHDGFGTTERSKCAGHRHGGGCANGCHSRMACPIGAEHRDRDGQVLHAHTVGRRTLQRWFGLGVWRVVPRFLRGGPRNGLS